MVFFPMLKLLQGQWVLIKASPCWGYGAAKTLSYREQGMMQTQCKWILGIPSGICWASVLLLARLRKAGKQDNKRRERETKAEIICKVRGNPRVNDRTNTQTDISAFIVMPLNCISGFTLKGWTHNSPSAFSIFSCPLNHSILLFLIQSLHLPISICLALILHLNVSPFQLLVWLSSCVFRSTHLFLFLNVICNFRLCIWWAQRALCIY